MSDKYYFVFKKDKIIGYTTKMNLLNKYFDDRLNILDSEVFNTYSVVYFDSFEMIPDDFLNRAHYNDPDYSKELIIITEPFSNKLNSYYVVSESDDKVCGDYVQEYMAPKIFSFGKDILHKMKYVNLSESEKRIMHKFKEIVDRYFKDISECNEDIYGEVTVSFRKVFELLLRRGLID